MTTIFSGFIWSVKPDKVPRNTMTLGYENGGLKMIDVECHLKACKVMWIKRCLSLNDSNWKLLFSKFMNKQNLNISFEPF